MDAKDNRKKFPTFHNMVGGSAAMRKVFDLIGKSAKTDSSVLIVGESGVGKELAAKAVHELGPRKRNPFVAVNCGALPEHLIESELFGHEKGAFTGALKDRKGRFESARSGTLFLDEIGEMPLGLQPKLLRVLQEKTFQPLGSDRTVCSDAKVVAGTNRDLMELQRAGAFRLDLYFRLNVLNITIPPLRERGEDIEILARWFLNKYTEKEKRNDLEISPGALKSLKKYHFPGNVRELSNLIERAVVWTEGNRIENFEFEGSRSEHRGGGGGDETGAAAEGEREGLLADLKEIEVVSGRESMRKWHETLRCVSIENICDFLHGTGGREFSRKEFARFLETVAGNGGDKYKTAGVYLKILTRNDVCEHNGQQANRSGYIVLYGR